MEVYLKFLGDLLYLMFGKIFLGIKEIILGFINLFNVKNYIILIKEYGREFSGKEWFFVLITIIIAMIFLALIILLIFKIIKCSIKRKRERDAIIEEILELHDQVNYLVQPKKEKKKSSKKE